MGNSPSTPSAPAPVPVNSRLTPPVGAITVCATGECDWPTISSAVDSISNTSTDPTTIFIYNGTYTEQVYLPPKAGRVTLMGQTADTTGYEGNTVRLQLNASLATRPGNEWTAPLVNESPNTAVYNIELRNLWGQGMQAGALSAYNTSQGYYGVSFYGSQDTLLAEVGNQLYAGCYIEGMTDFIYGEHARAWIVNSTVAANGYGWITASGRVDDADPSWYVITDSRVVVADGADVDEGSVFLGRPWRDHARVTFQRTDIGSFVNSTGWDLWTPEQPQTDHVTFEEFDNSGPGADTSDRVPYATVRNSPLPIEFILGSDYKDWVDELYLPSV